MTASLHDHDARELIASSGLDRTLFVEAGAGTGKTTQLVDRIVQTVVRHGVALSAIAAITFTEAAASELQARIRVQFERLTSSDDEQVRARASAALAEADMAAISTVHGFANRILGEFPVAAGLPPRIGVLDEVATQLADESRWERFVDRIDADPAHEELMYRAALLDIALTPRYVGHGSMKDVAANFAQNWDRLEPLARQLDEPMAPIDFSPFDDAVRALESALGECVDHTDKLFGHVSEILVEMQALVSLDDDHRKLRRMGELHRGASDRTKRGARKVWGRSGKGRAAAWNVSTSAVKDVIDDVNDGIDEIVSSLSNDVLERLMHLIADEVLEAARQRQRDGGLEFHDLLVLARQVLRNSAEVRRALHQRYRHILLDEFQDTDPIQIEIASLIAASPAEDQPRRWQEHEIDGGRLFFVGDPKQSIYRFRRADIALFLAARDIHGDDVAGPVRLGTNFRTVAPIIEWVNKLFADAMPEEKPGAQPRYERLDAARATTSDADHRPVVLGGEHEDPDVKAGELRAVEARDVADVIARIRDAPADWPVFDEFERTWRSAELSDVTVLIPTRTSLPFLREALVARDLPYRLATGTLVYDTQEVRDALAVLRTVDDPHDELSLVAALRSPLYGCSDVDLYEYHAAHPTWSLRDEAPEGLGDGHPVVAALAHLRSLWDERWWTPPSAMLERILRERHGFLLGYGTPRPDEVWRRLRFLVDQARSFEESNGGSIREFLSWAELQSADGSRVHEPMLPETDDEAVQILTVHGSKGLEFPIAILSGMTTQPGSARQGVSVIWDDDDRPQVRLRASLATAEHHARADVEAEMDADEKLRLLYVAATRARDHLVVSAHHTSKTKNGETYASRMAGLRTARPDLSRVLADRSDPGAEATVDSTHIAVPDDSHAHSALVERDRWIDHRASLIRPYETSRAVSATAVARSVDATIADVDADDRPVEPDGDGAVIVRTKGRAGSAIGSAVHATLEFIDFGRPDGENADLDALVRRQCDVHAISHATETVAALVRSALGSQSVELARHHPSFRELYVAAPLGDSMIEGYVDLLVQTPDGLVIVDYKTDSASSPAEIDAKLAAYELQGATYAVALEASTGMEVVDCRFVFCRAGGAIERSVDHLDGAKQRVRDAVASWIPSIPLTP